MGMWNTGSWERLMEELSDFSIQLSAISSDVLVAKVTNEQPSVYI